jgi:hypothetical protein
VGAVDLVARRGPGGQRTAKEREDEDWEMLVHI